MILTMLKAKIHRAKITQTDLEYNGSITIDRELMDACGLLPFEQVDVLDINNGSRFTTYVIEGEAGSGIIGINGAAARLVHRDDLVIICAYTQMTEEEAKSFSPSIIQVDDKNRITQS